MSMQEQTEPILSFHDVTQVVRMLGDIAGMSGPIDAKRIALMQGLVKLINADNWLWAHARIDPAKQDPVWFTVIEGGWRDEAERNLALQSINHPSMTRELFQHIDKSRHTSFTRQQHTPAKQWESDDYRREFSKTTHINDTLVSLYPVSEQVMSTIGISRRDNKPAFSSSEVAIAHLVLGQVTWLHNAPADVPANTDVLLDVPRRQREVLIHLIGGATIKQIADRLGISAHTVTDYTKALYRRFDVGSRAELVRKFMSGAAIEQAVSTSLVSQ